MTGLLWRVADIFDSEKLAKVLIAFATILAAIAAVGGALFNGALLFDSVQIVSLAFYALALACISTIMAWYDGRSRDMKIILIASAALWLLDLIGLDTGTIIGLPWWWLLLLISACLVAIDFGIESIDEDDGHDPLHYRSAPYRLSRVFIKAMVVLGIGLPLIYRTWSAVETTVIIEAALAVVFMMFRGAAPDRDMQTNYA